MEDVPSSDGIYQAYTFRNKNNYLMFAITNFKVLGHLSEHCPRYKDDSPPRN